MTHLGINSAAVQYDIGRILCGQVRAYLESEKFRGRKIEWLESKGWISHLFTIKGEADDVVAVAHQLDLWAKQTDDSRPNQ